MALISFCPVTGSPVYMYKLLNNNTFVIIKRTRLVITHLKNLALTGIMVYGILHLLTDRCIVLIICQCPPVKELGRLERKNRLERTDRSRKQDKKT